MVTRNQRNGRIKGVVTLLFLIVGMMAMAENMVTTTECGVLSTNTAAVNKKNLQLAIDKLSSVGGCIYVEPTETGFPMDGGIILKKNVSLIGVHGPTGRGTSSANSEHPVGSLFCITDRDNAFITVESATQIRGIQFYYPEQAYSDPAKVIPYKPTIQMAQNVPVQGVTLSCLTFYGEYFAMDFRSDDSQCNEQILFEHCYGYPLSGQFIAIDKCYDIPRILHCHVNPANMRLFGRTFSPNIIDYVVSQRKFTYWIDNTDNAQLMDLFTFGTYGGIYLGHSTYGQLTNFNLDCVSVGIFKGGDNQKNRNWMISQGSIIANAPASEDEGIHPFVIEGMGHASITNVEAFSGTNPVLTCQPTSTDVVLVKGDQQLTVTLTGCRWQGYSADSPITNKNPQAKISVVNCVDKSGNILMQQF